MTTTNTFKTSDDFANYILDSVLDFGEIVTEEFNKITGLSLPVGTNLSKVKDLPNAGQNYEKFGSVKGWIYDLYEMKTELGITYQTVVNHEERTITTYEVTPEIVKSVTEMFKMFIPKEEPVYSLGFQRYEKLSRARIQRAYKAMFLLEKIHESELYNTLHSRLTAMTEEEFKSFKRAK